MEMFDTLKYTKKAQESGIPNLEAEFHAETLHSILTNTVATKHDIKDLQAEIKAVERHISNKIELMGRRIIITCGGMIILAVTLLIEIFEFLYKQ